MKISKEFVKVPELAKICRVKPATIKYYSEQGLLKYHQTKKQAHKLFNPKESFKRIKEIKYLQRKGYSIDLIKKKLRTTHSQWVTSKKNK